MTPEIYSKFDGCPLPAVGIMATLTSNDEQAVCGAAESWPRL